MAAARLMTSSLFCEPAGQLRFGDTRFLGGVEVVDLQRVDLAVCSLG
jgi:hypothetical protein